MTHKSHHCQFRAHILNFFSKVAMYACMLTHFSHVQLFVTTLLYPTDRRDRLLCPWDSPGKNTGVGGHALLQGIFLNQKSKPHLVQLQHCRRILSHWGNPKLTYDIMLVSSAQQSDSIFLNILKWFITISLVTICHHRDLLRDYWLYSLYVYSITMVYFITGSLYLLISSLFYISPYPSSSGKHQFVLCVCYSISVLFPVYSYFISEMPHINKTVWHLSFTVCLDSLVIIPSRSIHVVTNDKIIFLNC